MFDQPLPTITLRYFDCRGRAQPLRFLLRHLDVSFVDERVPFTDGWQAWSKMKWDPVVSGPFGKLPVLEWDRRLLVETGPIYSFVQSQLKTPLAMSAVAEAQSALSDDLSLLYELLNLDLCAPGADDGAMADRVCSALADSFRCYEALLNHGANPFGPPRFHSVAAFWLLEVWQLARALLGTRASALIDGLPELQGALDELSRLPAVANVGDSVPRFWSARPDEHERLRTIQSIGRREHPSAGVPQ